MRPEQTPGPLSRFEFATRDVGAAHDVLRRIYAGHTFQIHRAAREFAYRHVAVDADPTRGDTVAAIARRWGYLSLSRFAADYRAAYGRSPRETLIY